MKIPADHPVNVDVLVHGMSINQAAKKHGLVPATVRLALLNHPDYDKAKAEGRLHEPLARSGPTLEELRSHPAVIDAVGGDMTYDQAARKHGIAAMTLGRWVKKAYPENVAKRGPGGRPKKMDSPDAATQVALATVRHLATALNSDPVKVCRDLLRRLEAEAYRANEEAQAHPQ